MVLRARWILPMCGPPIRDGVVEIEHGRIQHVGAEPRAATDRIDDLGDVVLLPGLINAHCHLELTAYADAIPPCGLWEWLPRLVELRRREGAAAAELSAVSRGIAEMLAGGTTCVADISRTGAVFDAVLASPIRKVLFVELISDASAPPANPEQLGQAVEALQRRARGRADTTIGVSPHALYTVASDDLEHVARLARRRALPMTLHLCETADEVKWLAGSGGAVEAFLARFPGRPARTMARGNPTEVLDRAGVLAQRPLLAHCNYVSDGQIAALARSGTSVVYCPRAHRYYGHSAHPWRDMLAAGVNVCLGTDSRAAVDSLSVLDELRYLRRTHPQAAAAMLVEMATVNAARALGFAAELGALRPGAWADLAAIPLASRFAEDPCAAVTDGDSPVLLRWICGRAILPA